MKLIRIKGVVQLLLMLCVAGYCWQIDATEPVKSNTLTVAGESVRPNMKALFISIENYKLAPLAYASNDISKLSTILQLRYGCSSEALIDLPGGKGESIPDSSPDYYKKAVEEKIVSWCASVTDNDVALLYLAGHGIAGQDKKLYLPMVNFDRKNFDTAAIPMSWIREQLAKSKGKAKLILLDTCFSGIGKGLDDFSVCDAITMARSFDDLDKVTTLASSREDQKSWIWPEMKHSLFTYWLIEAFEGNADTNSDHYLTINELYDYLDKNVSWISSNSEVMRPQNPTILNPDNVAKSFKIPIPAAQMSDVINNLASQIDLWMKRQKLENLILPEFITGEQGYAISSDYGTLPKSIAENLARTLGLNPRKNYSVFSTAATQKLLSTLGIRPEELGADKTSQMKIAGKPVRAILSGRINMYHPNAAELTVELLDAATMETLGVARGTACLDEKTLAQTGASFVRHENLNPKPVRLKEKQPTFDFVEEIGQLVPSEVVQKMQTINKERNELHPILNQRLPFELKIMVRKAGSHHSEDYQERTGMMVGNDYYVPIDAGEEYALYLKNKNTWGVFAKVLIDGCNSIAQEMTVVESKDMKLEALDTNIKGKSVIAPRIDISDARGWKLEGTLATDGTPIFYSVNGFVDVSGSMSYPFTVSDSLDAINEREQYADQLGWITVAFYKAVAPGQRGTSPDVITVPGPGVTYETKIDKSGEVCGDLLVVYNIRYLSSKAFKELTENMPSR